MAQTLASITNALKDDYSPGLRNAVNNNNVIWGEVSRNTESIVGEQAVWSVHSGRSSSTQARPEGITLGSADRQRYLKPRDDLKFVYHTIKITGPAKHLTRNDTGAFVRAVESEVKGAERDLKRDMARQTFGRMATVNAALQSGTIATLDADPGAGDTFSFNNEPSSVLRHFFVGMKVGFVNPATGTFRTGVYEVESVDVANKDVVMTQTADAGIASGDMAVRVTGATDNTASVGSQHNLDAEINGLRFLIDDTQDYAGIAAATNPVWQAITLGSATTAISETILDEGVEKVEIEGNGNSPGLYVAEHSQRRKLASLLQSQKRYEGRELTLTSGWRGLAVARGALVVDRFCPTDNVFVLDTDEIELFVGLDFQWDEDDDGGVFYKALDDSDAIQARYKWYGNLEATVRNAHAKITLAEPTF